MIMEPKTRLILTYVTLILVFVLLCLHIICTSFIIKIHIRLAPMIISIVINKDNLQPIIFLPLASNLSYVLFFLEISKRSI